MEGFNRFLAVVNARGQYSIWPEDLPLPPGWDPAGKAGGREECLDFIAEAWTDITPRQLDRDASREAGR